MLSSSLLAAVLLVPAVSAQDRPSAKGEDRIAREVRHELVTLPYYSVFDNLAYKVNGYTVTLVGQATRPTLKSDAEKAVKRIEGVENVVNNIEVLPLSPLTGAGDKERAGIAANGVSGVFSVTNDLLVSP